MPYTILGPGYYTLNQDLSYSGIGNAISINSASDVILDLGGFAIYHSGYGASSGAAIAISTPFLTDPAHNIVIRNGTIATIYQTTPFGIGVQLNLASYCTIDHLSIYAFTGISDTKGLENKISDCQLDGLGGYGVYLNGCSEDAVTGNDIAGFGWGVVSTGSKATMVVNNYIQGNSQSHGMSLSPTDVYWEDFFPGITGVKVVGGIHGQP